jgi:hypothetical protein
MDASNEPFSESISNVPNPSLPTFQYTPLQPQHIRLLQLHHTPTGITATLTPTPLTNLPPYSALSYTWGSGPSPNHTLTLNSTSFPITSNLASFLAHYRTPTSSEHLPLWIDAVCINQSNNAEKSSQISSMAKIYTQAAKTIIWLGAEDEDSPLAFRLIRKLDAIFDEFTIGRPRIVEAMERAAVTRPHGRAWQALGKLMERRWWERVWVVQEVALARRAEVWCGAEREDWEIVAGVVARIEEYSFQGFTVKEEEFDGFGGGGGGWQMVINLQGARERIVRGMERSLEMMLRSLYPLQAEDPRDKVYGVLGIVGDAEELGIKPDYEMSVEEVYMDTTRRVMVKERNLGLLGMAGIGWPTQTPGRLSSWVPDFTNSGGNNWDVRTWAASGYSSFQPQSSGSKELHLRGFHVDVVKRMGSNNGLGPGELQTPAWFMEAEELFRVPGKNDAEFRRTLTADKMNSADDEATAENMEPYFESLRSVFRHRHSGTDDGVPFTGYQLHLAQYFLRALRRAMVGRRFCETGDGRLGLVPRGAEVGDVVCVVHGGQSPLLIRCSQKVESSVARFELVGTGYVHGLMYGEAFDLGLPEEDIVMV